MSTDNNLVATLRGPYSSPEVQANARLIAKAPELFQLVLEALEELDYQESTVNHYGAIDIRDWIKEARRVLGEIDG